MANGALTCTAELAEDVHIVICMGTESETKALKKGLKVMISVRPWFKLLLGADVMTPLASRPCPS